MDYFLLCLVTLADGMKLYKSENGVILTEGFDGVVPVKYFQKIESWPKRNPVPFSRVRTESNTLGQNVDSGLCDSLQNLKL